MARPLHRKHQPALSFDGDAWTIAAIGEAAAGSPHAESVFAIGNGFIGARGRLEAQDARVPAVYLNGVYEKMPIHYHEAAPGFATASDNRLPVPSGLYVGLSIDGVDIAQAGALEGHQRALDLQAGLLRRQFMWQAPSGARFKVVTERLASFDDPGLMALCYSVTAQDSGAALAFDSRLTLPAAQAEAVAAAAHDPRVGPVLDARAMRQDATIERPDGCGLVLRAAISGHGVASLMAHHVDTGEAELSNPRLDETGARQMISATLAKGATIRLVKYIAYAADRGMRGDDIKTRAQHSLDMARKLGFDAIKARQAAWLQRHWAVAAVSLDGDAAAQRALRFNMFQLLQAVGRDGVTSIAAKGQTGEGYEGHYFWDAEIFALPYFAFTQPATARAMLAYRRHCLDGARAHARAMGHAEGALFPWRTIGGQECSAYFPAGSAQYHINADIAYALRQYVEATGDTAFLVNHGAEMLFETARIWLQIGFHNPRQNDRFCIHGVTGPDEYTALVNNNFYTNAMAAAHLDYACRTWADMQAADPAAHRALAAKLALDDATIVRWRRAADLMWLPHDDRLGIPAQDDSFLDKQPWDFAATPSDHYPLLLHYHPLALYRRQVCKQADTVLAMNLLPDVVAPDAMARAFDYYEAVTVHDSTLSPGAFAVAACAIGRLDKAYDYFKFTVDTDLADLHGNTAHGLHMAALAASWQAVAFGFAGLRLRDGTLHFAPQLPPALKAYQLGLCFHGRAIAIAVDGRGAHYRLLSGDALDIHHNRQAVSVTKDGIFIEQRTS